MEKLKEYNLIILAIIGTILLILLIIGGGMFGYEMLANQSYDDSSYEPGIISEETADSLATEEVRKQIITFNQIVLIDSTNGIYLMPVSHRNLESDESTGEILGLTNTFTGGKYDLKRYKSGVNFNNLIVYFSDENKSKVVFENRISLSTFFTIENQGNRYVIISGTNEDSNKDGYIDSYDIQKLFIYDVSKEKTSEIKTKNKLSFITFSNTKRDHEFIAQFGLDRNENGEFEVDIEPKIYFKLDVSRNSLTSIVSEEQIEKLQKLLEGSNIDNRE